MPQNPNEPGERPQRDYEPRPDMERERDEPLDDESKGFEDDEDMEDIDPDSADAENDRDDMLDE